MDKYLKKICIFVFVLLFCSCSKVDNSFTKTEVNYNLTENIYSTTYNNSSFTESYFLIDEEITDMEIIFLDEHVNINGEYSDKNYTVDLDAAITNIINTGIVSCNTKFRCLGTSILNGENYYVIDTNYDNGYLFIVEDEFWVNTKNGFVYAYLDPTLPTSEHFAQYKKQIEEDDFRSRLIKISN